jgi:hypothetical protein
VVEKSDAAIDKWIKESALSAELRKWFGHDSGRCEELGQHNNAVVPRDVLRSEELPARSRPNAARPDLGGCIWGASSTALSEVLITMPYRVGNTRPRGALG